MIRVPDRAAHLARRLAEPIRARVQAYAVEAVRDQAPAVPDLDELRADVQRLGADLALLAARVDAIAAAVGEEDGR